MLWCAQLLWFLKFPHCGMNKGIYIISYQPGDCNTGNSRERPRAAELHLNNAYLINENKSAMYLVAVKYRRPTYRREKTLSKQECCSYFRAWCENEMSVCSALVLCFQNKLKAGTLISSQSCCIHLYQSNVLSSPGKGEILNRICLPSNFE